MAEMVNLCTDSHAFTPIELKVEVMTSLPQTDSAVIKALMLT